METRGGRLTHTSIAGVRNNITASEMDEVLAGEATEVAVEWWQPANDDDKVYVLASDDKVHVETHG